MPWMHAKQPQDIRVALSNAIYDFSMILFILFIFVHDEIGTGERSNVLVILIETPGRVAPIRLLESLHRTTSVSFQGLLGPSIQILSS